MALIFGFLLSIAAIIVVMFIAATILNITKLLDFKYKRYIFKKYDIEEIKNEDDAKIFIKKLFKFYAVEKYDDYYVFSFKTEKGEKYEINKESSTPFYIVEKFDASGEYFQERYFINKLAMFLMQYKNECNNVIKSKRERLLEIYSSLNTLSIFKGINFNLKSIRKILSDLFKIVIVLFAVAGFILSIQIFEKRFIVNPAYYLPNHPTKRELRQMKHLNSLISKLKKNEK
jgi:hypothetical protein